MNETSLAYVLVALSYLLPEADYFAHQLKLSCPSPLQRTNLSEIGVSGGKERLLGLVATTNYAFAFTETGVIHSVIRLNPKQYPREYFDRLAQQHSDVGPKEAYQLATQWLAAVDIDMDQLRRRYRHRIDYPKLDKPVTVESPEGRTKRTRIVPRFDITWNDTQSSIYRGKPYAVEVVVVGPSKELASLDIGDTSLSKRPSLRIPGEAVLMELPNEPFTNLWARRELSVTNVFGLLRTSTAYQAVMLRRMLDEANWTLRQLGLPSEGQVSASDLNESFVVPPAFGFRGCLRGKDSFFKFDKQGKLAYAFHTPPRRPGQDLDGYYEEMSHRPMLVDSNSVVTLATGWLRAIRVDVEAINRITKPVVTRYVFTNRQGKRQPSHIWWISWWDHAAGKPIVSVQVDGTNRNPDRIEIFETTYVLRDGIAITNADELMAVPDPSPQRDPLQPHLNVPANSLMETHQ